MHRRSQKTRDIQGQEDSRQQLELESTHELFKRDATAAAVLREVRSTRIRVDAEGELRIVRYSRLELKRLPDEATSAELHPLPTLKPVVDQEFAELRIPKQPAEIDGKKAVKGEFEWCGSADIRISVEN